MQLYLGGCACIALMMPAYCSAMPATMTYTHGHHLFTINVPKRWQTEEKQWFYRGVAALPSESILSLPENERSRQGWSSSQKLSWSRPAIEATIKEKIASTIDRKPGSVIISRNASGAIVFTGTGFAGRAVNIPMTVNFTLVALAHNVSTVTLPVDSMPADVRVDDSDLWRMGVREVVAIGESAYAKSPINRRHNIRVGVSKFNGHIIPQGTVFSFGDILGPVNGATGFRKELVIQGEETLPDYGGGLCQVSSTAYRGAWEYGLPIVQRKNHSYAVSYYSPQGTDATIYPPRVDLKFRNDTPGALLIQSFVVNDDHAYFIYYGTKDDRKTEVFGPYISNRIEAPATEKTSFTTDIAPGERRKAGDRHDGMSVLWYRSVRKEGTGATIERVLSHYEARPLYWQVGVTPDEMAALTEGESNALPSWIDNRP